MVDVSMFDATADCDRQKCDTAPVDYFDTCDIDKKEALELWHWFASGINDIDATGEELNRLRMATMAARVDFVAVSWFISSSHRFIRTKQHIANGYSEYVRLRLYKKGSTQTVFGDVRRNLQPGAVHLIDYSRPIYEHVSDLEQIGLYVPHWAIGYDPGVHPQHIAFDLNTPVGHILAETIKTIVADAPHLHTKYATALSTGFSGLLRAMISSSSGDQDQGAFRVARRNAYRNYIEENLRDPELGIDSLSTVFAAARSTIYRDFAEDGGINRYINGRRLERAYLNLADAPQKRGMVRSVGDQWGFSSASQFTRLFRERFGCTPGEVVGLRAEKEKSEDASQITDNAFASAPFGTDRPASLLGSWLSAL